MLVALFVIAWVVVGAICGKRFAMKEYRKCRELGFSKVESAFVYAMPKYLGCILGGFATGMVFAVIILTALLKKMEEK
jgi:hypothetical protein